MKVMNKIHNFKVCEVMLKIQRTVYVLLFLMPKRACAVVPGAVHINKTFDLYTYITLCLYDVVEFMKKGPCLFHCCCI